MSATHHSNSLALAVPKLRCASVGHVHAQPSPNPQPWCALRLMPATRNNFMLFPGRDGPKKALTYRTQNKRVKAAFADAGIDCTKVCHAFRHAVSRHLDSMG